MGADTGVGSVAIDVASVVADPGNDRSDVEESGVIRGRPKGELSARACLEDETEGVLSDLSFELELFFSSERGRSAAGMTRGASWRA